MLSRSRLVALLGTSRLDRIELYVQLGQGKGWASQVNQEVQSIRQLLDHEAAVVVDAGANVGDWTLAALEAFPQAQIHAIEPSVAADRLANRANTERVSIHRLAFSNHDGEAVLYANARGSPVGSLYRRELLDITVEQAVPARSLASWAAENGVESIDVLKLDVEGHELAVLQGAGDLLVQVGVLQFEFGGCNVNSRTFFRDFWNLLSPHFALYRLGPAGPIPVRKYRERDEVFVTTNYLAVRHRN